MEAGEKHQMERLAQVLQKLAVAPGADMRPPAALLTAKLAALSSRLAAHPSELQVRWGVGGGVCSSAPVTQPPPPPV